MTDRSYAMSAVWSRVRVGSGRTPASKEAVVSAADSAETVDCASLNVCHSLTITNATSTA